MERNRQAGNRVFFVYIGARMAKDGEQDSSLTRPPPLTSGHAPPVVFIINCTHILLEILGKFQDIVCIFHIYIVLFFLSFVYTMNLMCVYSSLIRHRLYSAEFLLFKSYTHRCNLGYD